MIVITEKMIRPYRLVARAAFTLFLSFTLLLSLSGCAQSKEAGDANPDTRAAGARRAGVNLGGAVALLNAAAGIQSATLTDCDTPRVIHRFTPLELDTLKAYIAAANVSNSLLATPAPWEVCLDLETGGGEPFVALYYGDVLRVNERSPRSPIIADSTGTVPAPGIADLLLEWEGSSWLFTAVQGYMGTLPSKSHLGPGGLTPPSSDPKRPAGRR